MVHKKRSRRNIMADTDHSGFIKQISDKMKDGLAEIFNSQAVKWLSSVPEHQWTLGGVFRSLQAHFGDASAAYERDDLDLINIPMSRAARAVERVCTFVPTTAVLGLIALEIELGVAPLTSVDYWLDGIASLVAWKGLSLGISEMTETSLNNAREWGYWRLKDAAE
jgi:hypothetical protein